MKRFYFFCSLMLLVLPALAQGVCLRTKSTEIQIDQEGCFFFCTSEKKEILGAGKYPLLTIGMDNQLLVPVKWSLMTLYFSLHVGWEKSFYNIGKVTFVLH